MDEIWWRANICCLKRIIKICYANITMLIWKCLWSHLYMSKVFFKDCKLLHTTLAKVGSNLSVWIINRDYLQSSFIQRLVNSISVSTQRTDANCFFFRAACLIFVENELQSKIFRTIYMYNRVWCKNIQRTHAKWFQVVLHFIQDHITWDLSQKLTSNKWREGRKCVLQNFRK